MASELVKMIKKMTEDARIAVRGARRDANELFKGAEKDKEISEDESKTGQKKIQELTDKYVKQCDDLGSKKEQETMEV